MSGKLDKYRQKRDFSNTPEPETINEEIEIKGEEEGSEGLRFVIQHHLARRDHYDFRLEWKGVLLSWAVPKGPSYDTRDKRLAVHVEDHPLDYRNFEGTIPKGEYGGGTVMLWDEGEWEPLTDVDQGLEKGSLKFALNGRRMKGGWALVRLKSREEGKENWLLLKEKDEYARSDSGITEYTTGIRTGRTMKEIEEGRDEKTVRNPFSWADVQLAKLVQTVPEGDDWLYEMKYDGYRILAFAEGSSIRLITRNNNDITKRFSKVAASILDMAAGRAMVLDGEMAVTDEAGRTDFQALQRHLRNLQPQNLTYIIFDILALDGADLRKQPLIQRKELLAGLMKNAPPNLIYSRHVAGYGKESFKAACELEMEGIIGKRINSEYTGTRNGDWIKLKCRKRQEFVIGGYTISDKRTSGVSSLLLGVYEAGDLIFAGRAGTGLGEGEMKSLEMRFAKLKRTKPLFINAPKPKANEIIYWLEPELIAEIEFAEWTKDKLLRQASFKGLREDKRPEEIRREAVEVLEKEAEESPDIKNSSNLLIEGIKITNPGKVIFEDPVITKADVVQYYSRAAERMLPYLRHRILSIVRCPKGVAETCFYKKHPGAGSKEVEIIPVLDSDGKTEDYFYIDNKTGLINEAQMGTIEFHTWGSLIESLEQPDMMVFDLDPDEGMTLDRVRQGVRDTRDILSELSLNSYLKTSGDKGYHVIVPLKPAASWDIFHDFARRLAEVMESRWPDRYTSNVRKTSRSGKIFIDWIRNGRGATSVAPYSLRARKKVAVSMPVHWDELDSVAPDGISIRDALLRIDRNDPWGDFFNNEQSLKL